MGKDEKMSSELVTANPMIDYLPSQIFDIISGIQDPEKPCTLAHLNVV